MAAKCRACGRAFRKRQSAPAVPTEAWVAELLEQADRDLARLLADLRPLEVGNLPDLDTGDLPDLAALLDDPDR